MTTEQEISESKKLVSAAKSVVSGQVGFTVGAFSISKKLYWLGIEWEARYPIFKEFIGMLPADLPVGSERLEWNLDRIIDLDPKLAEIEYNYRPRLLEACVNIIRQHG